MVASDEFGRLKLFRFPCVTKGAAYCDYRGHGPHVTKVCFTVEDSHVISVGGSDRCVFQWRVDADDEEDDAEVQDEDEDSDELAQVGASSGWAGSAPMARSIRCHHDCLV